MSNKKSAIMDIFQGQKRPKEVKNVDVRYDDLKRVFLAFIQAFTTEINFYFKNYNKHIREKEKKIDVHVKASKKEKVRFV